MKRIAVMAFGMCMLTIATKAQTIESKYGVDSAQTILNASIYSELVKQKNYEEALSPWRYVFMNAPAYQMNTYIRGEEIIENILEKTKKKEYLDTLMMVFDQRIKYFGDHNRYNEGYLLGKKGFAQFRFAQGDPELLKQAYANLMKSYELEGDETHPGTVNTALLVAYELVKKDLLSKDEFVNLYMKLSEFANQKIAAGDDGYKKCCVNLDGIFFDSGFADCATLGGLLTAKYEANKENLEVLKEISSLLKRRECTDLPVYATVAEEIYKKEPSADAAYGLAMMFLSKQDVTKGETYLKEAIDKSTDAKAKADYSYKLAQIYLAKKNYQQAKRYALEVLKINPNMGQAYILIGLAYAYGGNDYGQDDFEKHTVFWAAVDKFIKAKQVDPSVADEANKQIEKFSIYFPTKDEAFFRSITAGSTVKIGDWINETTVARFKD